MILTHCIREFKHIHYKIGSFVQVLHLAQTIKLVQIVVLSTINKLTKAVTSNRAVKLSLALFVNNIDTTKWNNIKTDEFMLERIKIARAS